MAVAARPGTRSFIHGAAIILPRAQRRADTGLTAGSNLMEADVPADRREIAAGASLVVMIAIDWLWQKLRPGQTRAA